MRLLENEGWQIAAGLGLAVVGVAAARAALRGSKATRPHRRPEGPEGPEGPEMENVTATLMLDLVQFDAVLLDNDGVPLFAGMPPEFAAEAIPVWDTWTDGKSWGPRPDRFSQWLPMRSHLDDSTYSKAFAEAHYFGVVENGSLEFYALGTPTGRECCTECERTVTTGSTVTIERRGISGRPPKGEGWQCTKAPARCYTLRPRPFSAHPRANVA